MNETDIYKKLYFHAFNRYSELIEQAQVAQKELEEMYLQLTEEGCVDPESTPSSEGAL